MSKYGTSNFKSPSYPVGGTRRLDEEAAEAQKKKDEQGEDSLTWRESWLLK